MTKKISLVIAVVLLLTLNVHSRAQSDEISAKFIVIENTDLSVGPNADFYEFSNGIWLKNNPVPSEYSRWSSRNEIDNNNELILKKILEEASERSNQIGSMSQKLGDLNKLAMDTLRLNSEGISSLKEYLSMKDAFDSKQEFFKVEPGCLTEILI